MLPTGDDLTIIGILIGAALAFLGIAMTATGWKHRLFIRAMFVLAGIFAIAGIGWPWLKTVSPASLTNALREVSQSPAAWFSLFIIAVAAYALYRRPTSQPTAARPPEGQPARKWVVGWVIFQLVDPDFANATVANKRKMGELEPELQMANLEWRKVPVTAPATPENQSSEWVTAKNKALSIDKEYSRLEAENRTRESKARSEVHRQLRLGSLVAKGFVPPIKASDDEIMIPPAQWRFLKFNKDMTEASGDGVVYTNIAVARR